MRVENGFMLDRVPRHPAGRMNQTPARRNVGGLMRILNHIPHGSGEATRPRDRIHWQSPHYRRDEGSGRDDLCPVAPWFAARADGGGWFSEPYQYFSGTFTLRDLSNASTASLNVSCTSRLTSTAAAPLATTSRTSPRMKRTPHSLK